MLKLPTATLFFFAVASHLPAQMPVDGQLQNAIEPLLRQHEGEIGFAILKLGSGEHYEYRADNPMPTASLIKLPLMVTAYRLVDAGKLDIDESIALMDDDKVPGSGELTAHFSSGIRLPLRDYLRLMIRHSDNTATNIVIDQVGLPTTAETMQSLGLPNTKLHSKLYRGDTSVFPQRSQQFGIGSTTASEMIRLLALIHDGKAASPISTTAMREHLLACDDDTKIAARLPQNTPFAHKTGAIANCRTDAGILETATGPVAVCFLSNQNEDQSWDDDNKANALAATIGELVLQRFGSVKRDQRLREGAFGELVEALQRTLNARMRSSPGLAIDGDFGPATRNAVEQFQRSNRLAVTGVVSEATWTALGTLIEQDAPVPPPQVVNNLQLETIAQSDFADPPAVTCKAWAIADFATGELRYESNSTKRLEAASTTKIMTAYLVLQYTDRNPTALAEPVQFSSRADNTVGSTSGLRAGETVTVRELLYGLLLPSGNDAAVALAEHFGGRIADDALIGNDNADPYDQFVTAMNHTATELGLADTRYQNPHGLSHEEHVISAADLIRLSYEAMKNKLFRQISMTRQFGCTVRGEGGYTRDVVWKNTNKLLKTEGYRGVKTGTTSAAGACLVTYAQRDGDSLLAVVLGSSSSEARYADTRNLLRWAWQKRRKPKSE